MAVFTVGLFFGGVFVVRSLGRDARYSLSSLGVARPNVGSIGGAGLGFIVGIGAVFVGGILSATTTFVLSRLGYSTESTVQQPFMDSLQAWVGSNPALAVPAVVTVVVVIGPACEELLFRGGIFNGLRSLGVLLSRRLSNDEDSGATNSGVRNFGASAVLAAILSSVFFALLHLEPVVLPSLFIFAVVLCYLFQKTGSLLPCFVAHATFNSFATGVIILSGLGVIQPLTS